MEEEKGRIPSLLPTSAVPTLPGGKAFLDLSVSPTARLLLAAETHSPDACGSRSYFLEAFPVLFSLAGVS